MYWRVFKTSAFSFIHKYMSYMRCPTFVGLTSKSRRPSARFHWKMSRLPSVQLSSHRPDARSVKFCQFQFPIHTALQTRMVPSLKSITEQHWGHQVAVIADTRRFHYYILWRITRRVEWQGLGRWIEVHVHGKKFNRGCGIGQCFPCTLSPH